jgi:RNA polymerase sigma-70 factor, ECF subfamily
MVPPPDDVSPETVVDESEKPGDVLGDPERFDALYGELRQAARGLMRGERNGHTLDPTGLVNQALVKVLNGKSARPADDRDLFAAVIRAMQQVLVDYARTRGRSKRGGGWRRLPLDEVLYRLEEQRIDPEELVAVIDRLAVLNSVQAEMIRMRYYLNLSNPQIADHFGLTVKTVENNLSLGRAWLRRELKSGTAECC